MGPLLGRRPSVCFNSVTFGKSVYDELCAQPLYPDALVLMSDGSGNEPLNGEHGDAGEEEGDYLGGFAQVVEDR